MRDHRDIALWSEVTEEEWSDWHWQLAHGVRTLDELEQIVALTPEERNGAVTATGVLKLRISPHIATLMDRDDPTDTLRRQFIPSAQETESIDDTRLFADVNADDRYSPTSGLVHRYPTKVLLFPSNYCGAYCRYCFRRKLDKETEKTLSTSEFEAAFEYIRHHKTIEEVILSGGDPLVLGDDRLDAILAALAAMPHIKIVRIHTRMPIVVPYRVTESLIGTLSKYKSRFPIYIVMHVDTVKELSPATNRAISALVDAGLPCLASCPLLRGVNDDERSLKELWTGLVERRVKPYYLFHSDPVSGLKHFLVPIERGLEIMRNLYDSMSGLAMPLYCFNVPDGGGHVLLTATYLRKLEPGLYEITNFEGSVTQYREPLG